MPRLSSPSGLWFELLSHGAVRRAGRGDDVLSLFVGSEAEGGVANLWLRLHGADGGVDAVPLLGPASPARFAVSERGLAAAGRAAGIEWRLSLVLASREAAWFWHVELVNRSRTPQRLDLIALQDVGLAPYAALRLNEHYVSHYVDLKPLVHAERGWVLAARQNQPVQQRHPWALMGSLARASSYATDLLQVQGRAARLGGVPQALTEGLPGRRLQHEHAAIALQDEAFTLAAGERCTRGFFGLLLPHHAEASSEADLVEVEKLLALPQAQPVFAPLSGAQAPRLSRFVSAPWLAVRDLSAAELETRFGGERRHAEPDAFFTADGRHVVLRAKEARVLRPHGHMLRGGGALVPDEGALTSTVWMAGVFHSMVTQGHVSLNRLLSTTRGYLGRFRSHGLRLFVEGGGGWCQLGVPSAFEMGTAHATWWYRHAGGLFSVRSALGPAVQRLTLELQVHEGVPLRLQASLHLALAGDDGAEALLPMVTHQPDGSVLLQPPQGAELARRFPAGAFALVPLEGGRFAHVGGSERLHDDGVPNGEPFVVLEAQAAPRFAFAIEGRLLAQQALPAAEPLVAPRWRGPGEALVAELDTLAPWQLHNALVHYLAPRGLEQYSGGGWGTRDVCQGPLEMLLAFDRPAPVRDLLRRTFAAQNPDGDWPQWFMFFERDRAIRAGDSHGDIVFWPVLGLARYLVATGDAALLDEPLPFHGEAPAPLSEHLARALALIGRRCVAGTKLAAYGHGDWNDALQPADPALRDRLCSAWTVTLHHQTLTTLAQAFHAIGRSDRARALEAEAAGVLADFRRLLVRDGVVAGYALFGEDAAAPELLLHPGDQRTGLHHSLLPMMHAVLADMLAPAEAAAQVALIRRHLLGPDGARLFDAPMAYRGGPMKVFQRAESSAYFGREIGVMYTHAHLRWAETLAHLGDAEGFVEALALAQPLGLVRKVASAAPRQSNCYYSSSDAAFADRYEAAREYGRVSAGTVALEGGWRIYSSGPGIGLALLWRHFVGLAFEHEAVVVDPVLPPRLDGLVAEIELDGRPLVLRYRVGSAGCGLRRITLGGTELPFARRTNPYRTGGAAISRASLSARRPGEELVIELS